MRRWLTIAVGLTVVTTACTVEPLEDPGIGHGSLTTVVYAADGSILAQWHAGEDRVVVTLEEIPVHVRDAVIAIEDERFWRHPGVDIQAVARAMLANFESGGVVQGGSTITQQYLKNVLLTPEVTVERKLEEAVLALRLEEGLDKPQILERYLNTVYFGHGAYGIATAANRYFGKKVSDLSIAEGALLAGLIQAPSANDPFEDADPALQRRDLVVGKMVDLGWIDRDSASRAIGEPLTLHVPPPVSSSGSAYFVEEVKQRLLEDTGLGATYEERFDALFRGGLAIHTTLDPRIQAAAEAAVLDVVPVSGPAVGMAAVDPTTGHVVALVGGDDFSASQQGAQFNLATQALRQPGSAFKPFVLAAALESGLTLDTLLEAGSRVTIDTDSGPWTVDNYNESVFPDLTLSEATVFSVNVVFARLVDLVGPDAVAEVAARAGITADLEPFHSIALGAQEVTVLDMASAYGTFAAEGLHVDPIFVTHIEDADGVNIYEATPVVAEAFDRTVAADVTAALAEVVQRGTGQQARIGRSMAGKTGTSQNHNDAWFVGYTPELSAAVWIGFPDALRPMEFPATPFSITGGTWPAAIWSRFASSALSGVPFGQVATLTGAGSVTVDVDLSTGFLAGPLCPRGHVQRVRLPADQAPTVICPIHNPEGLGSVGAAVSPDLVGLDLAQAVELLTLAGYQTAVSWEDGGPLASGTVFAQVPQAGAAAQRGSVVRVSVAGPEPGSTVPNVLGLPGEAAIARLTDAGVDHQVLVLPESNPEDAARRNGVAWKQAPAAGTPLPDLVTIWINP
ncbi:MAG: PBP1A family penicillin-binding protein [Acidimicrobiia bacterium]